MIMRDAAVMCHVSVPSLSCHRWVGYGCSVATVAQQQQQQQQQQQNLPLVINFNLTVTKCRQRKIPREKSVLTRRSFNNLFDVRQ
jgi:hypothetical protein